MQISRALFLHRTLLLALLHCESLLPSFSSVSQSCLTLCDPMNRQASLAITNSRSLPKPMPIESVMPSHPLLSPSPPAPNPSQHQGLFQ